MKDIQFHTSNQFYRASIENDHFSLFNRRRKSYLVRANFNLKSIDATKEPVDLKLEEKEKRHNSAGIVCEDQCEQELQDTPHVRQRTAAQSQLNQ